MKIPECINLEIAALEQQKPLRWTSSNHFQLKAKKALRRYYLCKKRRRANYHYKQYLQFNARSFDVLPKKERYFLSYLPWLMQKE